MTINRVILAFSALAFANAAEAQATELETVSDIPRFMEAYDVEGLAIAVVRGNDILYTGGFGETDGGERYSADTQCGLFSATKVLSSLTYASLVEDQALDLEARLGDLIDDAPNAWRDIPFYRLLNHSSGITMIVNRPEFDTLSNDPEVGNSAIYRTIRDLPLDYQPGEHSRYRQSGYAIGEMIMENQTGQHWPDLVQRHVTGTAGVSRTFHSETREGRAPLIASAGGYETTANDMAQIFRALNAGRIVRPEMLEAFLYADQHNFDGYSLGSILEEVSGVRTIGHRGGGARANIRYAPSLRLGVMACTDDRSNNELTVELADMVMRELIDGEAPLPPIRVGLAGHFDGPAAELIAAYQTEKDITPQRYDFSRAESLFNSFGYAMLAADRTEDSIAIFLLNTREFPNSPNTHDSLGEALFESGNPEAARASYERVLSLDPDNANATQMIERIDAAVAE